MSMSGSKHPKGSLLDQQLSCRHRSRVGLAATIPSKSSVSLPTRMEIYPTMNDDVLTLSKPQCRKKSQLGINTKPAKSCLKHVTTPSFMVCFLGHNSFLQEDGNNFAYLVKVALPRTASFQDLDNIVAQILKENFPLYSGGFTCRLSQSDIDCSCIRVAKLATEQMVKSSDLPLGMLLPLLGRIFVVLSGPSDLPSQSKHLSPVTTSLKRHIRNSVPLSFYQNECEAEGSWCPTEVFEGEDECPRFLSPIWDRPTRKRKQPVSPDLDEIDCGVNNCNCTLELLKEIGSVIKTLGRISKDFNFQGPGFSTTI